MKRLLLTAFSALLCSAFSAAQTVTITGNAFLEGETDHSGVRVVFTRTAPSALTDSVFTDATGAFSKAMEQGLYTIGYARAGFLPVTLTNVAVYADLALSDTTLETSGLSGDLSGVLAAGTYKVSGNITVAGTDTLRIMPGVRLEFKATMRLTVLGRLEAVGTPGDSIVFTAHDTTRRWEGIWFSGAASNGSHLSYALVEFSQASGIRIDNSSPWLTHLLVRKNTMTHGLAGAYSGGAGIYVSGGSPTLDHLVITDNTTGMYGGGLYLRTWSPLQVSNMVVERNTASYGGGGIYCSNGGLRLTNAVVSRNTGGQGAGIYFQSGQQDLTITNTLISDNAGGAGSLYLEYPNSPLAVRITNTTIVGEKNAHGVLVSGSFASLAIHNSILANNRLSGLCFNNGTTPTDVRTSCFYGNPAGNILNGPALLGTTITVNARGDSCDSWANIKLPPMFADSANADYRLTLASPCLNAGAADSLMPASDLLGNPRPVGWAPDMGCFEAQSALSLSAGLLDFGPTRLGSSTESAFTLTNEGEEPIVVRSITSNNGTFNATPDSIFIPSMGIAADTLRFAPAATGDTAGYVIVISNDPASPDTIAVTGFGASYTMALSRRDVDFGTVRVGRSVDSVITITNTGNSLLVIDSIKSDNPSVTCIPASLTIPVGASATDTLRFSPSAGDSSIARVVFSGNAFSSPDTITVAGYGGTYGYALSAQSIQMGSVRIGRSRDTVITLTNTGNQPIHVSGITCSAPEFAAFPSQFMIPVDSTVRDTLRFTPSGPGDATGYIVVVSDDSSSTDTLTVSGFGASYTMALSRRDVDFGTVRVGQSMDSVITITNTGNSILVIDSIKSDNPSMTCIPASLTIPVGSSATDTLRFSPTAGDSSIGHVVFAGNAFSSPDTITVAGYGATFGCTFSVRSIQLGTVRVGLSRDTVITLTNTGNQPIQISGVTSSTPAIVASPSQFTIPVGGTVQDTLRFTPAIEGELTAQIVFRGDSTWADTITVMANGTLTGVLAGMGIPEVYSLSQNYPNPFNPSTTIRYGLPRKSTVSLIIYNAIGQKVATLVDEEQEAAYHEVRFNAAGLASGIYFYRIHARQADGGQGSDFVQVHKLIFTK